jgi:hypothetical protein
LSIPFAELAFSKGMDGWRAGDDSSGAAGKMQFRKVLLIENRMPVG